MTVTKANNLVSLASRSRETRAQVLERLFHEHRAALCGFLQIRLGVYEEMDDIVQEVFVRLARMNDLQQRLPPDNESNRSFLFKVANNVAVDLERRKLVRRRYIEEQQAGLQVDDELSELTPEKQAQASEQLDRLKAVVMTLKPKCRDAFILNRFMHKSYAEVAKDMGISVKQVEKYLHQALMRIRESTTDIKGVE